MTLVIAWWDGLGLNMIGDSAVSVQGRNVIKPKYKVPLKVRKMTLSTGPLLLGCSGAMENLMVIDDLLSLDPVVFNLNGNGPTFTSVCMAIIEHLKDHPLLRHGDGHLLVAFEQQIAVINLEHLTCQPSLGWGIIGNPLAAYGALRALAVTGQGVTMPADGQSLRFTEQGLERFCEAMVSSSVSAPWTGYMTSPTGEMYEVTSKHGIGTSRAVDRQGKHIT